MDSLKVTEKKKKSGHSINIEMTHHENPMKFNMITITHDDEMVKKEKKNASSDLLCCLATSFHLKFVIHK